MCKYGWIVFFFFNDTATTEIYTLSLHDALPISARPAFYELLGRAVGETAGEVLRDARGRVAEVYFSAACGGSTADVRDLRSEEHTSELQSRQYLVCRLLLEKKKKHESQSDANST